LTTGGWFLSGRFLVEGEGVCWIDRVGRAGVDERRLPHGEQSPNQPSVGARSVQAGDVNHGTARHAQRAYHYGRVEGDEPGAVHAPEGVAQVVDAEGVEVRSGVPVDVHAHLNLAHELHQIDHCLPEAVPDKGDRLRPVRFRIDALRDLAHRWLLEYAVPVAVDVAPAGGQRNRAPVSLRDRERAQRATAVPDRIDRDRRQPVLCQLGGDRNWNIGRVLAYPAAVPGDHHRPAPGGRVTRGQEEVELDLVRSLGRGDAGQRPDRRDHPCGRVTIASEIGDISRFPSARKLIGYSGLTPRVYQSGQKARTGKLSKSGSTMLRWAAIEAAQQAWRPNNPWNQLYLDVKQRCGGKGNPAKAAVARKVLIATWQRPRFAAALQPLAPPRRERSCPGQLQLRSGRLTAHKELRSRDSSHRHGVRKASAERELSHYRTRP
jgi:Transposase IS116/IS110/IS902 family